MGKEIQIVGQDDRPIIEKAFNLNEGNQLEFLKPSEGDQVEVSKDLFINEIKSLSTFKDWIINYKRDENTIIPLRIDKIEKVEEESVKYIYSFTNDDVDVDKVTLVKLVVEYNETSGEVTATYVDETKEIEAGTVLPTPSAEDNGKVLGVIDGALDFTEMQDPHFAEQVVRYHHKIETKDLVVGNYYDMEGNVVGTIDEPPSAYPYIHSTHSGGEDTRRWELTSSDEYPANEITISNSPNGIYKAKEGEQRIAPAHTNNSLNQEYFTAGYVVVNNDGSGIFYCNLVGEEGEGEYEVSAPSEYEKTIEQINSNLAKKQDKLTAGSGIEIENNRIYTTFNEFRTLTFKITPSDTIGWKEVVFNVNSGEAVYITVSGNEDGCVGAVVDGCRISNNTHVLVYIRQVPSRDTTITLHFFEL